MGEYGSSLHTWDLTNRLSSYTSGLKTIDDDLTYLYGQLPSKIGDAASAVKDKADRKVLTDISVAGINVIGTAFGVGGSLLNDLTDTDTTTPTIATSLSNAGDVFQALAFTFGRLYGLNKDTTPSCGVADFVKTWDEYYEAANLRETYKFLSSASYSGRSSLPSNSSHARYKRTPDWTPFQTGQSQDPYSYSGQSQDRSYSTSQSSMLDLLTVD